MFQGKKVFHVDGVSIQSNSSSSTGGLSGLS
jgi:hypothetical protein